MTAADLVRVVQDSVGNFLSKQSIIFNNDYRMHIIIR